MKIVIDAGHGLNTPGKRVPSKSYVPVNWQGVREWILNVAVAKALIKKLAPYNVDIVRADDISGKIDIPRSDRRKKGADAELFLSIHFNGGIKGGKGGGTVVYYYKKGDKLYAQHCYNAVVMRANSRGNRATPVCFGNFEVLRGNKANHSLLVECAFMDSPDDLRKFGDKFFDNIAQGLAEYIIGAHGLERK